MEILQMKAAMQKLSEIILKILSLFWQHEVKSTLKRIMLRSDVAAVLGNEALELSLQPPTFQ